jgi:hypothetical protein
VQRTPRPAARLLLAGRFVASRASLVACPDGPVAGVDLATGRLVGLSFGRAGEDADGLTQRIAARDDFLAVRELRRHLGRPLIAYDLVAAREPPPEPAPAGVAVAAARPRRGAVIPRSRRARALVLVASGVLSAILVSSLTGASPHADIARAAPLPLAPAALAPAPPVRPRTLHVPAPRAAPRPRGGAAEVLLQPVPPRAARPVLAQPPAPVRADTHSEPGWVEGLFMGSS